ncbi:LPS assembly lipoprotein LptE [Paracoccus sp. Z330]|uniref:LPS assembly lipoprotein LptE n=1 Tax=Paracoccus onchidii TaxID=3017813 RepID=A0ABT4ZHX1_9RHOB|nr:LPS assembly lipoprotein LptE [Paracoccus onchidii]MDB6178902.1 LPS assembly lipoprotein LptE [Paracoccus onchidii]
MWSRNRIGRRAALLGVLALSACGLQPVYGPQGAGKRLFGKVRPRDPDDYQEFVFNTQIAQRLGPESADAFDLDYRLSIGVVSQAITQEQVTTRYSLNGTADYVLKDSRGRALSSGRVSTFSSYSTTGTTIATLTAEADARRRLARMLADQVVTRLLADSPALPET